MNMGTRRSARPIGALYDGTVAAACGALGGCRSRRPRIRLSAPARAPAELGLRSGVLLGSELQEGPALPAELRRRGTSRT